MFKFCFRPRSGNYESEYISFIYSKQNKFPSPLGELWIWMEYAEMFNISAELFPSPLGELWIWIQRLSFEPSKK